MRQIKIAAPARSPCRKAAHAAGFDRHVVKPADPGELRVLLADGGLESKT
jgi:hypothetical protein